MFVLTSLRILGKEYHPNKLLKYSKLWSNILPCRGLWQEKMLENTAELQGGIPYLKRQAHTKSHKKHTNIHVLTNTHIVIHTNIYTSINSHTLIAAHKPTHTRTQSLTHSHTLTNTPTHTQLLTFTHHGPTADPSCSDHGPTRKRGQP